VLANDLQNAVSRADNQNINTLPGLVVYCTNYIPMQAWGSYENIDEWLDKKRKQNALQKSN
jgi:hypothetical protein